MQDHSKLFPSLIYSKTKAKSKHNHYKIFLKCANFSQGELSTTCNSLTTRYSLFFWTFHIFNLFPQVIPFFLLNPMCGNVG
jgi:chemotaxis methyl-accepting protein methylase